MDALAAIGFALHAIFMVAVVVGCIVAAFVTGQWLLLVALIWALSRRAVRVWKRARLTPIGMHEARHTFASIMIAAGVNAKALATYMGHSSVTITLDRYGHLMPGNEGEAATLVDAFLSRATSSAT